MMRQNPLFDQPLESNDPFGLSKFSLRRYSVQHMLTVLVVIGLLVATNVQAALHGNLTLRILAGTILGVTVVNTVFLVYFGGRTVAVEAWIRRLGMGDFEYRIEPRGRDEVSKSCEALETLRQSSIRAMQLDLVQELSDELREKNAALEHTLDELKSAQDRIISQQSWPNWESCPPVSPTRSATRSSSYGTSRVPPRSWSTRSGRCRDSPRSTIPRKWTS